MTLRIWIISSLLMTLALTGFGCHRVKTAGQPDEGDPGVKNRKLKIGIYMVANGKCAVDFPVAAVSKGNNHTAGWYATDNAQYRIDWPNGSPFANGGSIPTLPSPKVAWGGPLAGTLAHDYYPYSVTNLAQPGSHCKEAIAPPGDYDPGLHVTP